MQYFSRDNRKVDANSPKSSFQMRFLIAMMLFAIMILLDKNNINLAGITVEDIKQVISADYETYLENWVTTLSTSVE